jgi:hypothetical protein
MLDAMAPAAPEFRSILARWVAAESGGDVEALAHLLDADFHGDDALGFVLTKEQWLDRYRTGDLTNARFEWYVSDIAVRNDTAVSTGTQSQTATYRGIDCSGDFHATLVAVNRGPGWSIVNVQLGRQESPGASVYPPAANSRSTLGVVPSGPLHAGLPSRRERGDDVDLGGCGRVGLLERPLIMSVSECVGSAIGDEIGEAPPAAGRVAHHQQRPPVSDAPNGPSQDAEVPFDGGAAGRRIRVLSSHRSEAKPMQPVTELPTPSKAHATCAWCHQRFTTVVELLDHVVGDHLDDRAVA